MVLRLSLGDFLEAVCSILGRHKLLAIARPQFLTLECPTHLTADTVLPVRMTACLTLSVCLDDFFHARVLPNRVEPLDH